MFFSIGLFFMLFSPLKGQDFLSLHLKAQFDTVNEKVLGEVWQEVLIPQGMDTLMLNGVRLQYQQVKVNDLIVKVRHNDTAIFIPVAYTGKKLQLYIKYEAQPRKGLYFIGWQDETRRAKRQIWTQGQGIDHRHWIPHRDDQRDKITFSAEIVFNAAYQVMSNGFLDSNKPVDKALRSWHYSMEDEMSSYLIALAIGKYEVTKQVIDSCPHHLYHYPERMADSSWYYHRHQEIISFLNQEIAYPYPWGNYKQAPVMDFRHGAMENTCATIFGDFFLVDSVAFNDRNYTYVDAHEYAHQWFGNLVTAAGSKHHWLHEGFATYYQWLSEGELYGQDYFEWELQKAKEMVFSATELEPLPLAHPKAGSYRFYQKGGWLLYMLRDFVGDSIYKVVIADYLQSYAYQVVENRDLIERFKEHSDQDITGFFKLWLYEDSEPVLKENGLVKGALQFTLSARIPQKLEYNYLERGIWKTAHYSAEQGLNRIPLPDGVTDAYLSNLGALLIRTESEPIPWRTGHHRFHHRDAPLNQLYVQQNLELLDDDELVVWLKSIGRNKAYHFSVRAKIWENYAQLEQDRSALLASIEEMLADFSQPQLQLELLAIAEKANLQLSDSTIKALRNRGRSYELRNDALRMGWDPRNWGNNDWLYDARWAENPGIVGRTNYVSTLFFRSFEKDEEARQYLYDLAGSSFDFNTRMNALDALSALPIPDAFMEMHARAFFQALFNKNWKLSKKARLYLLGIQAKYPSLFKKLYELDTPNWNDFQKRRVARIFEIE